MAAQLDRKFFSRRADVVAKELLGKVVVRRLKNGKILRARIVETEAYFDEKDPASRAVQNGDLRKTMEMVPGTILVYGVHNNWLVNFVTGREGNASAVLIRAIEPLNFEGNGKGPGLLTRALHVNKEFHKKDMVNNKDIWLENSKDNNFEIVGAFRVGIRNDLPKKFRFYIRGNEHVSRR